MLSYLAFAPGPGNPSLEQTMKHHLFAAAFAVILALPAFAGLEDLAIKTDLRGEYVLGIITSDQRPYVVSGETPSNIAGGYISGMFRKRYKTYTDSEAPVADEISNGLRKAFLKNKWFSVATIETTPADTPADIVSMVKTGKLKRTLVFTVTQLWTESYKNTSVDYNFTITVFDDKGQSLATANLTGRHDTREWGCDGAAEILSAVMNAVLVRPEFITALK
jgi:hypothetical protein